MWYEHIGHIDLTAIEFIYYYVYVCPRLNVLCIILVLHITGTQNVTYVEIMTMLNYRMFWVWRRIHR